MSHHILHVLQHGAVLGRERGFITCRAEGQAERRLPLDDIRAVIIAARGVTLTSSFLSGLMETDSIVLHCNDHYQPCGWTAPLARVVDLKTFQNQTAKPRRLNERLWQEMLRGKTLNQSRVLQHKQLRSPHLELALKQDSFDEANCARRYWQLYFPAIGWTSTRRDQKEDTAPNQMLNYGYAVLAALCHRSLIIHGLLPQLGVHHKPRYRSDPLVYDLMESFRPAVELMLAEFMLQPEVSMKAWAKTVGIQLRDRRVRHGSYTLKLMDAIDASANSLARAYEQSSASVFWVPELPEAVNTVAV
ncbi:MAG TPA: type II CRISPR-associated endonuclease Cas1 [Verrucomicrobiae bacterium]|nr:type II CRISPR-associated endonuclease Cas1 [Verrucomicrobiae bacterium]